MIQAIHHLKVAWNGPAQPFGVAGGLRPSIIYVHYGSLEAPLLGRFWTNPPAQKKSFIPKQTAPDHKSRQLVPSTCQALCRYSSSRPSPKLRKIWGTSETRRRTWGNWARGFPASVRWGVSTCMSCSWAKQSRLSAPRNLPTSNPGGFAKN